MARTNLPSIRPLRSQPSRRREPGQLKVRNGRGQEKPGHLQKLGGLSDYNERRKQHAAAGRTPAKAVDNTKKLDRSVMGKWERFCSEINENPKTLLRNLKAQDVKAYFDWIEDNFKGSIKADSSFSEYWRVLKRLYVQEAGRCMDESMRTDILNYKNVVSERMGLRKLPKPKPVAVVDDLGYFLVVNLVWCDAVFPDEQQRFYMFPGLNMSSISGCRAVSLFDTRGKAQIADAKPPAGRHANLDGDTLTDFDHNLTDGNLDSEPFTDSEDTLVDGTLDDGNFANRRNTSTDRMSFMAPNDLSDDAANDSDDDAYHDTDMGTEEDSDTDEMDSDGVSDTETDADSDLGLESDASSVTDDGYLAGKEETRTILWRHIAFYIIRSPVPGQPNILFAIVTLLHTKGEDRKPRIKRFVIEHEYNPLFDLLGQLLAMAMHDDIFDTDIFDADNKNIERIYRADIPYYKRGMQLKIKRDKLDMPIFREPERSAKGYRTSDDRPLKARTWSRNVKRLGVKAGLEENLTQKVLRRGTINAINNKAPSSVRDQIADHESNAVKYYINEVVEFDTAAAFLGRPSNEAVQKEARMTTLMADMTAPTDLDDKQKAQIPNHPRIKRLVARSLRLTDKIKKRGYRSVRDAEGTAIYDRKIKADDNLNRARTRLREKLKRRARKRHFRSSDTMVLNQQFGGRSSEPQKPTPPLTPPVYQIRERAALVPLICRSKADLTVEEEHARRLECIKLWIKWQDRQESQRRGKLASASKHHLVPEPLEIKTIPEKWKRRQCPFCIGNESKPYHERTKELSSVNKLWDHVESVHRDELAAYASGKKACDICKARRTTFTPSSVPHFKNHTQQVHAIRLRP